MNCKRCGAVAWIDHEPSELRKFVDLAVDFLIYSIVKDRTPNYVKCRNCGNVQKLK